MSSSRDLRTITQFMAARRPRELALLLLLLPATAAAEMLMVTAIVPVLAMLGERPAALPMLPALLDAMERLVPEQPLLAAALLFVVVALVASALRLVLSWLTLTFAARLGHDLNQDIQHRLLHQPYLFHVTGHSSRLLASLDKVDLLVHNLIQRVFQAVGAAIIALAVIAALLRIDPLSAAGAAILVALIYGAILLAVRPRIARSTRFVASGYDRRIQRIQENLSGIRDIILNRSQAAHLAAFDALNERFMRARAEVDFLATAPRFLVEGIGLGLVALIGLYVATRPGGLPAALPVLGALALGAQRLLPLTSQIYAGWISLWASGSIIGDVAALLRLPVPKEEQVPPLPFEREIALGGVGFHYPGRARPAVDAIDLVIPRGSRVAIVGRTGSGKSTLADLLMGLIEPTQGQLRVDGVPLTGLMLTAWRQQVAHVPQSIFLADASIAANIAFSSPNAPPDMDRVRQAASMAQLDEFIASLPDGFDTSVGEQGVRLSGGQRQRLALARAIYKQARFLVLDEATSALDHDTEAAVLASLDNLQAEGCTIVIIAHRLSTVRHCQRIFMLEDGKLVQSGSYGELSGQLDRLQQQGRL